MQTFDYPIRDKRRYRLNDLRKLMTAWVLRGRLGNYLERRVRLVRFLLAVCFVGRVARLIQEDGAAIDQPASAQFGFDGILAAFFKPLAYRPRECGGDSESTQIEALPVCSVIDQFSRITGPSINRSSEPIQTRMIAGRAKPRCTDPVPSGMALASIGDRSWSEALRSLSVRGSKGQLARMLRLHANGHRRIGKYPLAKALR